MLLLSRDDAYPVLSKFIAAEITRIVDIPISTVRYSDLYRSHHNSRADLQANVGKRYIVRK